MRPSLSIAGGLALVSLRDVAVSRWANQVSSKLDENRMLVTEKVFGFLVAVMAVPLILDGWALAGVIPPTPH
jgi:small neutral amino acid transporter SnatA (MarC family)